jgi:hypothetical protein
LIMLLFSSRGIQPSTEPKNDYNMKRSLKKEEN